MKRILAAIFLSLFVCGLAACAPVQEEIAEQPSTPETSATVRAVDTQPPRLIAHAGGAVFGYRYTNSMEALDQAYENGFRHIELDFEQTSDGKYVLIHDWDSMAERMLFTSGVYSRSKFLKAKTFVDLTLMDLDMLLDWLAAHDDCCIITDAKCDNEAFLKELADRAGESVYPAGIFLQ